MKKLFCILLALVMLLCVAACGDDEDSGRRKKDKDKTSSSSDKDEKIDGFSSGFAFSDGVAVVRTYKKGVETYYVIDKEGYIQGELKDFESDYMYDAFDYMYKNGVLVQHNKVYDKTGKVIASPEETGYTRLLTDARVDGKILAVKIEENYDGDTLYFGILNNKGKWEEPLSVDHALARHLINNNAVTTELSGNNFYTEDVIYLTNDCYYNLRTGQAYKYYNYVYDSSESVYDSDGYYIGYTYNIYSKTSDEESVLLAENMTLDRTVANGYIAHHNDHLNGVVGDEFGYYDIDGNLITKLDAVEVEDAIYTNGYLVLRHKNSTGSTYISVYSASGEKVVEPFRYDGGIYSTNVWEDYGVLKLESGMFYTFEGEKISFDEYAEVNHFGEGLFMVRDEDWNYFYIDIKGKKVIK